MRAPPMGQFYASVMGTGTQIVVVYSILFALFSMHMLSHLALRPMIWNVTILGMSCTGFVNGYVLTYYLKAFKQTSVW